jgi:hypothetical protein
MGPKNGEANHPAEIADGRVEPPSWWNVGSWFRYSAQVQPEVEVGQEEEVTEHEDTFV